MNAGSHRGSTAKGIDPCAVMLAEARARGRKAIPSVPVHGGIECAWRDRPEGKRALSAEDYLARSADNGKTWTRPALTFGGPSYSSARPAA